MGLLDQLNINPAAIAVNIVGFLLLLFVLQKMVFRPIGTVLTEREQDVNGRYDRLEADQRQMDALKADYEQRLASIEAEAREKIQSAIKDAQAARDQITAEAAARSREMIQRAEAEVAHEREQAMITFRQQVVDLAMGAATKVIGDSLDETRQRRLIDDFITTSTIATAPNVPATGGAATTGANGTTSGNGGSGGAGVYPTPGAADR
jgi:F-type H+-transporting ATPase subunit b